MYTTTNCYTGISLCLIVTQSWLITTISNFLYFQINTYSWGGKVIFGRKPIII